MAKAKLLPGLSADTALKDAATALLLTRADEAVELLGEFLDTDAATSLHGARTAVRRLRTALHTLGRPLRDDDREHAAETLKRVFKRLGRARDLDVQLALIGRSAKKLRRDLTEKRARRYKKARRAVKKYLHSANVMKLRAAITDALVLRAAGLSADYAQKTLKSGADEILTPLTDELLKRIKQAREHADDPEALHRLRLAVKAERDAFEMLSGALPQLGGWQKRLTALAAVLGDVHDVDVLLGRVEALSQDAGKKRRRELEAVRRRAELTRQRLASEIDARVSAQALHRLELDLRNARAGAFFEDPSAATVH